ncbi:uncharacterized protein LOC127847747 isoform X4 [Dreissena polymorpha]|uniref:B box-type domain-containing protein n=1 Tax=Dreissena polymorpha TaxID=45954 RepID=A0A9D4I7F7_DREPO|nr:uncharacterized protein LOC127847747 isoform X4 [Dreissena polymorpha]KAH3749963.1 hypothetical protein DPMN_184479 [Dreissena polymorpha]
MESSLAAKGSDTIWDFTCSACQELEAQCHCEECCKGFCDSCVKLHNQLYKTHTVFGREQMDKWPLAKSTLDSLEQCEEHIDEKIKLFCDDHSQLCCHICVALHHRSCSKVSLIEEANKYSIADVHDLSSNIQKIQEELKNLKNKAEGNLLSLEMKYQQLKEEIDTVRQKINKELDRLETATMQEVEKLIAKSKISLTKERDKLDSIHESLQCLSKVANEVCNKSSKLLFIALEKSQKQIKDSELFLKESKLTHEYGMEFVPSNDIERYLFNCAGLGRVCQPNGVISLHKKSEYSVKMSTDVSTCSTYAICELPTGETLVLDYTNNRVKLLDKKYQCLSNCEVLKFSYDMCLISAREVVVTTNEASGIGGLHVLQVITVGNDRLEKGWKLKLPHRCVGVAHHEGDLYVTSGNALYQYTLTGTIVKKLFEDTTSSHTVYKCAVNFMGDQIYVTNREKHTLLTLAMDGKVISTFSDNDLKVPLGVHVTAGGQVLVCGYGSNTIIHVNSEGKKKLATLATEKDGVKCPCSVFYSCSNDSVLVGVANNDIIVFKVI